MIRRQGANKIPSAVNAAENETIGFGKGINQEQSPDSLATVIGSCNFRIRSDGSLALRKPDIELLSESKKMYIPMKDGKHTLYIAGSPFRLKLIDVLKPGDATVLDYKYRNHNTGAVSYVTGSNVVTYVDGAIEPQNGPTVDVYVLRNDNKGLSIRAGQATLIPAKVRLSSFTGMVDASLYPSGATYVDRFLSVYFDEDHDGWVAEIVSPEIVTVPTSDAADAFKPNLLQDNPYAVRDLYKYGTSGVTGILAYALKSGVSSYALASPGTPISLRTSLYLFRMLFQVAMHVTTTGIEYWVTAKHSICFKDPEKLFPKSTSHGKDPFLNRGDTCDTAVSSIDNLPNPEGREVFTLYDSILGLDGSGASVTMPLYLPKGHTMSAMKSGTFDPSSLGDVRSLYLMGAANFLSNYPELYVFNEDGGPKDPSKYVKYKTSDLFSYMLHVTKSRTQYIDSASYSDEVSDFPYAHFVATASGFDYVVSKTTAKNFALIAAEAKIASDSDLLPKARMYNVGDVLFSISALPGDVSAYVWEYGMTAPAPNTSNTSCIAVKTLTESVSNASASKIQLLTSIDVQDATIDKVVLKALVTTTDEWRDDYCLWEVSKDGGVTWDLAPEFFAHWKTNGCVINVLDAESGNETLESAGTYKKALFVVPFGKLPDGSLWSREDRLYVRPDVLVIPKGNANYMYRFRIFHATEVVSAWKYSLSMEPYFAYGAILPRDRYSTVYYASKFGSKGVYPSEANPRMNAIVRRLYGATTEAVVYASFGIGENIDSLKPSTVKGSTSNWNSRDGWYNFYIDDAIDADSDDTRTDTKIGKTRALAYAYGIKTDNDSNFDDIFKICYNRMHGMVSPFVIAAFNGNTRRLLQSTVPEPYVAVKKYNSETTVFYIGTDANRLATDPSAYDIGDDTNNIKNAIDAVKLTDADFSPYSTFPNVLPDMGDSHMRKAADVDVDDAYGRMPKGTYRLFSTIDVGEKPDNLSNAPMLDSEYMEQLLDWLRYFYTENGDHSFQGYFDATTSEIAKAVSELYNVKKPFLSYSLQQWVFPYSSIGDSFITGDKSTFTGLKRSCRLLKQSNWGSLYDTNMMHSAYSMLPQSALPFMGKTGMLVVAPGAYVWDEDPAHTTEKWVGWCTTCRCFTSALWLSRILVEKDTVCEFEIQNRSDVNQTFSLSITSMVDNDAYKARTFAPVTPSSSSWQDELRQNVFEPTFHMMGYSGKITINGVDYEVSGTGTLATGDPTSDQFRIDIQAGDKVTCKLELRCWGRYGSNGNGNLFDYFETDIADYYGHSITAFNGDVFGNSSLGGGTFYDVDDAILVPAVQTQLLPEFVLRSISGTYAFGAPSDKYKCWYGAGETSDLGGAVGDTAINSTSGASYWMDDTYVEHALSPNQKDAFMAAPVKGGEQDGALQYKLENALELSFIPFSGLRGPLTEYSKRESYKLSTGSQLYYENRLLTYNVQNHKSSLFVSDPDSFIYPLQNEITFSYGSDITAVIPWRDYVIVFTENSTYMLIKDASAASGFTVRTVNSQIGVPASDGPSVQAILNGILFKSGNKVYVYTPGRYSTVDTMLNIRRISDPIEDLLIEGCQTHSFVQDDEWHLFQGVNASYGNVAQYGELVYNYANNTWVYNTHPMRPKDSFLYGTTWRIVDDGESFWSYGKDYDELEIHKFVGYGNYDLSPLLDMPYGDYVGRIVDNLNTHHGFLEELATAGVVPSAIASGVRRFLYQADTGQKSSRYTVSKQFLEAKFNLMSLDEKDAFPFEFTIYADGMPHAAVIDANTDSALWRNSKNLDGGAVATTFGDGRTSNVGIMRQMFVKYSGKGKTLRITFSGSSESRFALYTIDSRYRVLPNKQ